MNKTKRRFPAPDAPAVVTGLHVRDRVLSTAAGAPKGYRKLSPFEAVYRQGKLAGGSPLCSETARYEAGGAYAEIFALAQASGRDSTDMDRIDTSGGGGNLPFTQSQRRAMAMLDGLHGAMGARDAKIVLRVCGQGYWPAEAVREVCGDYRDTVAARFREALDGLVDAFAIVRRRR